MGLEHMKRQIISVKKKKTQKVNDWKYVAFLSNIKQWISTQKKRNEINQKKKSHKNWVYQIIWINTFISKFQINQYINDWYWCWPDCWSVTILPNFFKFTNFLLLFFSVVRRLNCLSLEFKFILIWTLTKTKY